MRVHVCQRSRQWPFWLQSLIYKHNRSPLQRLRLWPFVKTQLLVPSVLAVTTPEIHPSLQGSAAQARMGAHVQALIPAGFAVTIPHVKARLLMPAALVIATLFANTNSHTCSAHSCNHAIRPSLHESDMNIVVWLLQPRKLKRVIDKQQQIYQSNQFFNTTTHQGQV